MARRRARLTPKKKPLKKKMTTAPAGGLSAQQFAALAQNYGQFHVEVHDANEQHLHAYEIGDVVYIQHKDLEDSEVNPEEDYWIGEIKEIRGNDSDDVWACVQWFWSPEEVAQVIKSFKPTNCGKYEKLSSDNLDIISVHTIVSQVDVTQFDETSINQVSISDDEWFYRYEFLYKARRIVPKVTHNACVICRVPYAPHEVKIHHFCPRPRCRVFYHQSCLVKNKYVEETRRYRILETWPDTDRSITTEEIVKIVPGNNNCGKNPLSKFPHALVSAAEQQIVRGVEGSGIVGNITSVTAARNLIYKTLVGDGVLPKDWQERINTTEAFAKPSTVLFPNCFCPSCFSPI